MTPLSGYRYHTLAYVPSCQRLFAFGLGGSGQLGSGRTQSSTLPVLAYEGPILDVATGGDHAFIIMVTNGTIIHLHLCRYPPTYVILCTNIHPEAHIIQEHHTHISGGSGGNSGT